MCGIVGFISPAACNAQDLAARIEKMTHTLVKRGPDDFGTWTDREKRSLVLARDRMGQKPLCYGFRQKCFFFFSELKALHAHDAFKPEISDYTQLMQYLDMQSYLCDDIMTKVDRALLKLIKDADLRKKMDAFGREMVIQSFPDKTVVGKTMEVYK